MANPNLVHAEDLSPIVVIESDSGNASGFLARMNGKIYLVTNQHTMLGATAGRFLMVNGRRLRPKGMELCHKQDLVRMEVDPKQIPPTLHPLRLAAGVPSIDQAITVEGNSSGEGVITKVKGKVLGVGPEKVEVSAAFVEGNSGSPILDPAGQVVGVATYVSAQKAEATWINEATRFRNLRYFGLRITSETRWRAEKPATFLAQGRALQDNRMFIHDIKAVLENLRVRNAEDGTTETFIKADYNLSKARKKYSSEKWPASIAAL